jgi:hypothetical protein
VGAGQARGSDAVGADQGSGSSDGGDEAARQRREATVEARHQHGRRARRRTHHILEPLVVEGKWWLDEHVLAVQRMDEVGRACRAITTACPQQVSRQ